MKYPQPTKRSKSYYDTVYVVSYLYEDQIRKATFGTLQAAEEYVKRLRREDVKGTITSQFREDQF